MPDTCKSCGNTKDENAENEGHAPDCSFWAYATRNSHSNVPVRRYWDSPLYKKQRPPMQSQGDEESK